MPGAAVQAQPKVILTKDALEASLCRRSFYDFFLRFWATVSGEPLVLNWHIQVLCDELQAMAVRAFGTLDPVTQRRSRQPKLHDLIVNIPPGSTKSTICSVMFPVWCWLNDPTFRTICGSYSYDLALYLAEQSSRICKSDKFKTLYPELQLVKNTGGLMVTKEGGWRYSTSTGGTITGMHGHMIIVDDPINPKEALSEASLRAANAWMDHTLPSRVVDKRIAPLVLVMQRLAQDDPTGHRREKQNGTPVRFIRLPAILNNRVLPRNLRKNYKNGLFDPVRLPADVLQALEQGDMGPYAYAGQYLQEPIPAGGGMFKVDALTAVNSLPRMLRMVRFWDKAGTGGKGAYTVGALVGIDKDRKFWIMDIVRGQWEASARERIIKQTAVRDGKFVVIGIEQEPGSGGKESAQATVRNLAGWRVRVDKVTNDKPMRADPFSVQVNGGNVGYLSAPWNASLVIELQFFPFGKFKDQVDALSGAFNQLTEQRLPVGALFSTLARLQASRGS